MCLLLAVECMTLDFAETENLKEMKPGMVIKPVVPGLSKRNQEDHKGKTQSELQTKAKKI